MDTNFSWEDFCFQGVGGGGGGLKHGTRSRDAFERVNMSVNSKDSDRSMNLPCWSRYFVPVDSIALSLSLSH